MSKLSFEIFCIEHYTDKVRRESCKVYEQFKKEGLLELLRTDYEDLCGMGMEYMIHFCADYLGEKIL
ncbi:MAG: DUF3791 domain-containing protein [Bacillus sp. (in: Bacteria)]|nr:DUF3791 domain-containing protein [Bacillus sp. (in: firmicutes)]MCM1426635.1 DUF3791 domain-containing protein [Eubacterium sp.]